MSTSFRAGFSECEVTVRTGYLNKGHNKYTVTWIRKLRWTHVVDVVQGWRVRSRFLNLRLNPITCGVNLARFNLFRSSLTFSVLTSSLRVGFSESAVTVTSGW